MRNWLKKYLSSEGTTKDSSQFWMKKLLHHPYLWHLSRESVARGVAVGLFAGIVPILPFQTLLAVLLSILIRANLPIAFLASWISNPLTILPIAYFTYFIGNEILGDEGKKIVIHEMNWNDTSIHELWMSFTTWIMQFGKAFFIGLPILAFGTAILGYLLVILFYYVSTRYKKF